MPDQKPKRHPTNRGEAGRTHKPSPQPPRHEQSHSTAPAEERGERIEMGKAIARGGKSGEVSG